VKKATHNGTCQACGRAQAAMYGGNEMSNHGYTVTWGYFNGVCSGAGKPPLEVSREWCDGVIKWLHEEAAKAEAQAVGPIGRVWITEMTMAERRSVYDRQKPKQRWYTQPEFETAKASTLMYCNWHWKDKVDMERFRLNRQAKAAREHADMLAKRADERFGQPLMERRA